MTNRITLKEYGDWLFDDKPSIIYEEKTLDENWLSDTALDVTQLAIGLGSSAASMVGAIPVGVALGAANVGISFVRGDWLGVVLGLFPILDEVAPSFNILRRITDFLRNIPGGAQALQTMEAATVSALRPLISWIGTEGNAIVRGLNYLKNFVGQNTDRLIQVIRAGLGTVAPAGAEIPSVFRPIYDFLQSSGFRSVASRFENFDEVAGLANSAGTLENVLNGIRGAFGQVQSLIDDALRLVGQFGSQEAGELVKAAGSAATGATGRKAIATASDTLGNAMAIDTGIKNTFNPAPVVAEGLAYRNHNTSDILYNDIRFKRLAGIK